MEIDFYKPGYATIQGEHWRIVEVVRANGKHYLNLIRRGKVRTVKL